MSKTRPAAEQEHEMEMTPMIDVTFLLLIFFMCTIRFKTLEGRLSAYLPRDLGPSSAPAEPVESVRVTISVREPGTRYSAADPSRLWSGEGRFAIRGRRLSYQVGPSAIGAPDALAARLRQIHADDAERPLVLTAGPKTTYADVVVVLDAALDAGFTDVTFSGAAR